MSKASSRFDTTVELTVARRVARACEEFAAAWGRLDRPSIESVVEQSPAGDVPTLLPRLIATEVQLRRGEGEEPEQEEYLHRFPAEVVAAAFRPPVSPSSATEEDYDIAPPKSTDRESMERDLIIPLTLIANRYQVKRIIGRGGFAVVYEAHDSLLDRPVALKVPWINRFHDQRSVEAFVTEARNAAKLYHAGVVQVHDVLREPGHLVIVLQYIDGPTLAKEMKDKPVGVDRAVELMIGIADAVNYAHAHRFVHRDLKPANILLDARGRPHVADFGLAVHESARARHRGELAGTFPYMSPEQVRGEAHRLDGRSDIWSLGILFYELLTGVRPFHGATTNQLMEEIEHGEPVPPRQINQSVPRELARICLKCLCKQASGRYETAADLADDLAHWKQGQGEGDVVTAPGSINSRTARSVRVVPKGLRSFDASDADFFLDLLPGPRDRDGLPESVRFWKRAIESTEQDQAFAVGLIYGPSGCGKSSMVRAGLLPRLDDQVAVVYVEAAGDGTEDRLSQAIRRRCPELPDGLDVADQLAMIRRAGGSAGKKVLLVIDQFEQWLHARGADLDGPLARGLRQCDGPAAQAILLVRDDFWMSVTRFLRLIEIPQVEGKNTMAVDLFDRSHARRVLAAFGRAFERLPEGEPTTEQSQFLDRVVKGLSREGRVMCVRLALFAEMMKSHAWTPSSLKDIGGTDGVGVRFLEDTFFSATAPPSHVFHQQAARAVLAALLPEAGSNLKGQMQPEERLLEVSGYAGRPRDFGDLMEILHTELRLITPSATDGAEVGDTTAEVQRPSRCYQLTHDYLVPTLRNWLAMRQRRSRRGRAQLALSERAELWASRPEKRQLPSSGEWLSISMLTKRQDWTEPQRRLMNAAGRYFWRRIGLAAAAILVAVLLGMAGKRELERSARAHELADRLEQLWTSEWRRLPEVIDELEADPGPWQAELERVASDQTTIEPRRLRASLALARVGRVDADLLATGLVEAGPETRRVMLDEVRPHGAEIASRLWARVEQEQPHDESLLWFAESLSGLDPASEKWGRIAKDVARALVRSDRLDLESWVDGLRPVRAALREPLADLLSSPDATAQEREMAARILVAHAAGDAEYIEAKDLAERVLGADPECLAILKPILEARGPELVPWLRKALARPVPMSNDPKNDREVDRQANAAQALLELGHGEHFWPYLARSEDPRLRTLLVDRVGPSRVEVKELLDRLESERDAWTRQAMVMALDGYRDLPEASRREVIARVGTLFDSDPDAGVHAASEWVLGRWTSPEELFGRRTGLAGPPRPDRNWYVDEQGRTMVILRAPGEVTLGPPEDEIGRDDHEIRRKVRIDHDFAISAHEITVEQFLACGRKVPKNRVLPDPSCPATYVSWYDAVFYCRWSTSEVGLGESDMAYPDSDLLRPGMPMEPSRLEREGFRLPTAEEWEYAARAGTLTSRYFGNADELLDRHAWMVHNTKDRLWPVGELRPNQLGLFDILGNAVEWCDPGSVDAVPGRMPSRGAGYRDTPRFLRASMPGSGDPHDKLSMTGFRIARTIPRP